VPDRRGRRAGSPTGAHRYPRTARVNRVLREVIADEIERVGERDPRIGLLTVTGVEVDPDLRSARVWFSSLSEEAAEALGEERIRLQSVIAGQVRLKRTPLLRFAADPAIESANRIEDIMRDLDAGPEAGAGTGEART
jgi:ribosome-binding factor A